MSPESLPSWFPTSFSEFAHPFFHLSYPTTPPASPDSFPDASYYESGPKDILLLISCIAVMALLRDISRIYVFEPFARWKLMRDLSNATHLKANGQANAKRKPSKKDLQKVHHGIVRFAEQGWDLIYYTVQWCFGYHVNTQLPNGLFNHTNLWVGFPHMPLSGPLKFYYITQTAFYTHQILAINAEAKRKDHVQMMAHHIITVILMGTSYFLHFTRAGSIIMVLMDWCDVFLPLAKMMKYIGLPHQIYDYVFGWFLLSWFATRHVIFPFIIYSTIFEAPTLFDFKWYSHLIFSTCLSMLQILQLMWFFTICRVAYSVLMKGEEAADVRSDEEGEEDDLDTLKIE